MLFWQKILINVTMQHDLNQCHLQVNRGRLEAAVEDVTASLLLCYSAIVSCLHNDIISLYLNGHIKVLTQCQDNS